MTIFHKIVNAAANRLSLSGRGERDLVETVLRQLPQTVYWRLREQGFAPAGIVDIGESRSRDSAQADKWNFCLTAGTLWPANQERQ